MYIYKNKTVEHDRDRRERTVKISEVLYLRKANQIHHYIVENFADGRDEFEMNTRKLAEKGISIIVRS